MNVTQNYKLQKPLGSEKYSIAVQNYNMDLIDAALTELQNSTYTEEEKNAVYTKIETALAQSKKYTDDMIVTITEF